MTEIPPIIIQPGNPLWDFLNINQSRIYDWFGSNYAVFRNRVANLPNDLQSVRNYAQAQAIGKANQARSDAINYTNSIVNSLSTTVSNNFNTLNSKITNVRNGLLADMVNLHNQSIAHTDSQFQQAEQNSESRLQQAKNFASGLFGQATDLIGNNTTAIFALSSYVNPLSAILTINKATGIVNFADLNFGTLQDFIDSPIDYILDALIQILLELLSDMIAIELASNDTVLPPSQFPLES